MNASVAEAGGAAAAEEMEPLALVLTTAPAGDVAEQLVRRLLGERLIACANVVPGLASVFRWNGSIQRESEVLILMKTRRTAVKRLVARITEMHPYEVPELLALPVESASAAYSRWVAMETAEVPE
jgi:periplasmic divalent cation tolerance protein